MGWFDEQIKQRKLSDQEVFEDSFMYLAKAVLGSKFAEGLNNKRYITTQAIDAVLRFYGFVALVVAGIPCINCGA